MKYQLSLLLFVLTCFSAAAQKPAYLLYAYGQKTTNMVCGEKLLFNNTEVLLLPAEVSEYRKKYLAELKKKYNSTSGYKNVNAEVIAKTQVVICYEGERKYNQKTDGWSCSSTFYGCVYKSTVFAAENEFAKLKAQYKNSVFTETLRWGNAIMQSPKDLKDKDLDVRWVAGKNGFTTFFTNTRKDVTLKVVVTSFTNAPGITENPKIEGDFSTMKKLEETTTVLEPGSKAQVWLKSAEGFEVDVSEMPTEKEEGRIIEKIKHILRKYLANPNKKEVLNIASGSRG